MTITALRHQYLDATRRYVRAALTARRCGDHGRYILWIGFARQSADAYKIIR